MNYSMISYILGWIFNFEAAFMILPGITAIIYREKNGLAFLITMLICLTIGIPLTRRKRKAKYSMPKRVLLQLLSAGWYSVLQEPFPLLFQEVFHIL